MTLFFVRTHNDLGIRRIIRSNSKRDTVNELIGFGVLIYFSRHFSLSGDRTIVTKQILIDFRWKMESENETHREKKKEKIYLLAIGRSSLNDQ